MPAQRPEGPWKEAGSCRLAQKGKKEWLIHQVNLVADMCPLKQAAQTIANNCEEESPPGQIICVAKVSTVPPKGQ